VQSCKWEAVFVDYPNSMCQTLSNRERWSVGRCSVILPVLDVELAARPDHIHSKDPTVSRAVKDTV